MMVYYCPLKFYLRRNRLSLIANLILILFWYFILSFFGVFDYFFPPELPSWASTELIQEYENISRSRDASLISPKSPCVLPLLEPFNPEILHLVNKPMGPVFCENRNYPLIFESSVEPYPKMIPVISKSRFDELGISKCCFRRILKGHTLGMTCKSLSFENETRIPGNWEFVTVECDYLSEKKTTMRVVDMHAFPYPTERKLKIPSGNGSNPLLNVLILGLDATSHLNFRRTMPEVHDFLTRDLSALEFMGYHKIGENTLPNIGPLLTNAKAIYSGEANDDRHKLDCERNNYVDNCPFIWKRFKASGYTTLFGEDIAGCHIFGTKITYGFRSPPVDHFFQPFLFTSKLISHKGTDYAPMCFGPRFAFQVLLNYAEKQAINAGSAPYFQFVYTASVTHDFLNGPRLMVEHLLKTLQFFQQRLLLNNTLLILLSDHGSRLNEIRAHPQGYLEDKLPLLYFVVPKWFQKTYPKAYSNLQNNTRRLITSRDIYKTLEDILPQNQDKLEIGGGDQSGSPGISLFQQIPLSRTCETAHIPEQFCICNKTINVGMATNDPVVVKGAQATLKHINSLLSQGNKNEGTICAWLSLDRILRAERLKSDGNGSKSRYRIVLSVTPGNAFFEAEISKIGETLQGELKVDMVTRVNKYRDQSQCIDKANLKPFCYCDI